MKDNSKFPDTSGLQPKIESEPDKMEMHAVMEVERNGLAQVAWNVIACNSQTNSQYNLPKDLVEVSHKYLVNLFHTCINEMAQVQKDELDQENKR